MMKYNIINSNDFFLIYVRRWSLKFWEKWRKQYYSREWLMDIFLHIKKDPTESKKKWINDDEAMSSFRAKIKYSTEIKYCIKINRTSKIRHRTNTIQYTINKFHNLLASYIKYNTDVEFASGLNPSPSRGSSIRRFSWNAETDDTVLSTVRQVVFQQLPRPNRWENNSV